MKKLLLGVLLIPALAIAEPVTVDKKVVCDQATIMLPYIKEKYDEDPIWFGDDGRSQFTITANQKTKTWSIIQFSVKENLSCLVDSGTGFTIKLPGDPT